MIGRNATAGYLDVLCPMHVIVNRSGHIVHAGPTVQKLHSGKPVVGQRFLEMFVLKRPRALSSVEDLRKAAGTKLHLQLSIAPYTALKGILMPGPQEDQLLVNLSFGISIIDAVRDFELTSADFAATDMAIEMLYLVEAKSAAMEASRKLNLRLQGAKIAAEEQAFTDTLTGLKNRRAMDHILARQIEADCKFAIMHIDLDFFKAVNDTKGHAAGDYVLQVVSRIMVEETRETDTVGRVGGGRIHCHVAQRSIRIGAFRDWGTDHRQTRSADHVPGRRVPRFSKHWISVLLTRVQLER